MLSYISLRECLLSVEKKPRGRLMWRIVSFFIREMETDATESKIEKPNVSVPGLRSILLSQWST